MARNLRKFANPLFLKSVPLDLMSRLFKRHGVEHRGIDLDLFENVPVQAREALSRVLRGPEDKLPDDLIVALHEIAALGNREGLEILLQHAQRYQVRLYDPKGQIRREDPKHVALATYLDHPEIFQAASRVASYWRSVGIAEIKGVECGVPAEFDDEAMADFRAGISALLEIHLHGDYCELDSFEDDGDVICVIRHSTPTTTAQIVEDRQERTKSLCVAEQMVLSYDAMDSRLKMCGVAKGRQAELAELFGRHILRRRSFFCWPDAHNLYALTPIERNWPDFQFQHVFDPSIRSVRATEVQVDRITCDLFGELDRVEWSFLARDAHGCALTRLREALPNIRFDTRSWRIGHLVLRVQIDTGQARLNSVTVRIKPEGSANFKRSRFEGQIMELLKRNGFCRDRDTDRPALAAE